MTLHQAGPDTYGWIQEPALRRQHIGEIRETLRPVVPKMDTAPLMMDNSEMDD